MEVFFPKQTNKQPIAAKLFQINSRRRTVSIDFRVEVVSWLLVKLIKEVLKVINIFIFCKCFFYCCCCFFFFVKHRKLKHNS